MGAQNPEPPLEYKQRLDSTSQLHQESMQEVPLYPEPKSGQRQPLKCLCHHWQEYGFEPWAGIDAPRMCEPWLENSGGAKTGSARGRKRARVHGSGLLVTDGATQAGWPSGAWLRQRAGLGGKGEVQVMAGRNAGLGRGGSSWMCDLE